MDEAIRFTAGELRDRPCRSFHLQATTAWLGHSVAIANKHYLRVRAEHVIRVVNEGIDNTSPHQKTGDQVGAKNGATGEKRSSSATRKKSKR